MRKLLLIISVLVCSAFAQNPNDAPIPDLGGSLHCTGGTTCSTSGYVITINSTGGSGGGNVANSGTPTSTQIAQWVDATHIQGVNVSSITGVGSANALAGTPSLCSSGQSPTGILANGNATGCQSVTGSPGGSNGQIQTNNSGVFGGVGTSGSGNVALVTSPTFVTPTLGAATATSINKLTLTAPATGSTFTLIDGKTFTVNNTLTFAGTDSTTMIFPTTSATIARTDAANTFTGHQTIEGVTSTGATGTANFVFSASPTLTGVPLAPTATVGTNTTQLATTAFVLANGLVNPMSGVGDFISGGSSGTPTRLAGASTNGQYVVTENVTASTPVAATLNLVGLSARAPGSSSADTIATADCSAGWIVHDTAGSASVAITLPTATTLLNAHCAFVWANDSSHIDTITPTTWTITSCTGGVCTTGSTATIGAGIYCSVKPDPASSTNWLAHCNNAGGSTSPTQTALTDAATITWSPTVSGSEASVTLAGNRTLNIGGNPIGHFVLHVTQDGTGSRTLTGGTYNSVANKIFTAAGETPTISSGFGTSPSIVHGNTKAFTINVGTGGTAISGVVGLPVAPNGWACFATDITTTSTTVSQTKQTATSTTTATLGNFTDISGTGAWAASDILSVSCNSY